jgi:hypothetical protein
MSVPEDQVTYEFEASDKTIVHLRRMSDRQRTRFTGTGYVEANKRLLVFARFGQANIEINSDTVVSTDDLRPLYNALHECVLDLVRDLTVDQKDYDAVASWDHPGDWTDLGALINRIVEIELPSQDSSPIPPPEKVDEMSDQEVARLGESSEPKSGRGRTKRSSSVEATSSNGTESTQAEKLEIVETSPLQS